MNDWHKKPPQSGKQGWFRAYARGQTSIKSLLENLRLWAVPREKQQDAVKKTYLNSKDGPMIWLGEQIIKRMEKSGYPSRIFCSYRSPLEQQKAFDRGVSKARPWRSPHQYFEAVDIIHKTKAWDVSQDYWDTLAAVVRIVEKEYNVDLVHGYDWGWDSAHIEIKNWRIIRDRHLAQANLKPPTAAELDARFQDVLPLVYATLNRR